MKKFLVVLSAFVCILGLSVISSASTVYKPEQHSFVHEENGHYVLDVDIKASEFTEEQLSFWNSFMDAFTGNSSEYVPFIVYNRASSSLCFCLCKPNSYFFYYSRDNNSCSFNPESGVLDSLMCFSVNISTGIAGGVSSDFNYSKLLRITYSSDTYVFWGYGGLSSHSASETNKDKIDYVDWDGMRLQVQDDLGNDEPEEPDLPSSSSPSWIPPVVSDPVIPEGDEYVFYDTKILGLFLNHVRTQIVHAANVGWLIFGFILVWHVIKRVIKAFSSR